jgi:hypothetical protein
VTPGDHERARQLMAQSAIEGCSPADVAWLDAHLARCTECAREASALASVVASVGALSIPAPAALASRTRLAVHRRLEAPPAREGRTLLWVAVVFSMMSMLVTLPLAWWALKWIGRRFDLSDPVWEAAFLVAWFVPATVIAAVLAWQRPVDAAGSRGGEAYTW